jgi:hypothetical protein
MKESLFAIITRFIITKSSKRVLRYNNGHCLTLLQMIRKWKPNSNDFLIIQDLKKYREENKLNSVLVIYKEQMNLSLVIHKCAFHFLLHS